MRSFSWAGCFILRMIFEMLIIMFNTSLHDVDYISQRLLHFFTIEELSVYIKKTSLPVCRSEGLLRVKCKSFDELTESALCFKALRQRTGNGYLFIILSRLITVIIHLHEAHCLHLWILRLQRSGEHLSSSLFIPLFFYLFCPSPQQLLYQGLLSDISSFEALFPINAVAPRVCPRDAKTFRPVVSLSLLSAFLSQVIFQRLLCLIKEKKNRWKENVRKKKGRKGGWLCVSVVPRSFLEYDRYFGLVVKSYFDC